VSATAPYCDSAYVAFLLSFLRGGKGQDFSPVSSPTDSIIDTLVASVAGRIDIAYMSAGYRIPFAAKTGETWPTSQTQFLQHLNGVGTAAFMGGNVVGAPATGPGRSRSSGSIYGDEWKRLINAITDLGKGVRSEALLRADTFNGTPAERLLSVPGPATTDFLEGYYDPTRYDLFHAFTTRMKDFYQDMSEIAPESPDYLWLAHQNMGFTYDS